MSQHINPEPAALTSLAELGDDEPLVMLNLLRFRERANYPEGSGHAPCSGIEAYGRYAVAVRPHVAAVGAQLIFRGTAQLSVIGPAGEWDEVLLVQYPSRSAFVRMISDPDYLAASVHRSAALEDSRLIATRVPAG